ncbi:competence type IV pilus minor pilin ComGF [Atopococcus tabaci]|uniref:competence type IV pilus minor pilin ComGF n=1 Tax=Atopococcus tabaci TaxID=269774 RepID=UPI000A03A8CD|nr:competence type IV pilus minor pilin ComGF [Atopococcus tabaci]
MQRRTGKQAFKSLRCNGLNEKGFTLLEAMVALLVTTLTLTLMSYAVRHVQTLSRMELHDRQLEWHLFLNQMEYDLKETAFVENSGQAFIFNKYNPEKRKEERIRYEKYMTMIRRTVDGSGHQPMLTQVSDVRFERTEKGLETTVTFQNGITYTAWVDLNEQMEKKNEQ